MSGLRSRRKGRRGEQQLARILREALPEIADRIRRGWQARLGHDDADVSGLPGFWLEHKCGKQPNIRAAFKQAVRDAKGRAFPCAVIQDDNARERLVVLSLTDFVRILKSAYGYCPPLQFRIQGELFEALPDEPAASELQPESKRKLKVV